MISTHAHLRFIPMLISLAAFFAGPVYGQTDSYHILLTNDDGIESPGIQALAEKLGAVGQVHLVAPCGERSGSSMSVALRDQLHLRPVRRDGKMLGHCVDTTPAGTVMLAITALSPDGGFDLVVSGINRGANVGKVAHMSGTVGGAMMGGSYLQFGFEELQDGRDDRRFRPRIGRWAVAVGSGTHREGPKKTYEGTGATSTRLATCCTAETAKRKARAE